MEAIWRPARIVGCRAAAWGRRRRTLPQDLLLTRPASRFFIRPLITVDLCQHHLVAMKDLKDAAAADGEAAPPAIQALPSATAAGDSTALHMVASIAGGEDAIRALVEAGEDVNCHNCRGETPLMFAACSDAVRVLLELGADREAADEAGRTALMHAAHEGYGECGAVRGPSAPAACTPACLRASLYPNAMRSSLTQNHKRACLSLCAEEAVSELLAAGANAGACCRAGLNALAWAAGGSHARCVQLLAPATPADERWAAIEFAARAQSAPCLEALTACGMTAAEARRALLIAMHDRRLVSLGVSAEDAGKLAGEEAAPVPGSQAACIAVLAAAGADLNAPTPGTLPLMHAARARSVECVRALLQHGASPDAARPGDGATALHAAAGCADVVRELLAHGARSAVAVCEAAGGVTPLMTTASVRNVEAVQALLEAPDAAEALEMRGVSGKTALAMAVWSYRKHGDGDGAAAVVKALLGAGANVEAADNDGARPLHWWVGRREEGVPGLRHGSILTWNIFSHLTVQLPACHLLPSSTKQGCRFGLHRGRSPAAGCQSRSCRSRHPRLYAARPRRAFSSGGGCGSDTRCTADGARERHGGSTRGGAAATSAAGRRARPSDQLHRGCGHWGGLVAGAGGGNNQSHCPTQAGRAEASWLLLHPVS